MRVGVISNNDLCLPLLFFLLNNKIEVALYLGKSAVIDPKREDVHRFCSSYQVPLVDVTLKQESIYQWMNTTNPDFLFVLGHLQKIDCEKVTAKAGVYNIHFGKLPEYRGASPVFWQMKAMEPSLGVSIHELTNEMDAGPVYWNKEIRNEDHFTHNYVQYLFSNIMLEGVSDILIRTSNGTLQPIPQDESKARWHAKPSLRDVLVNWEKMSAAEISSLVKACNSWNVGAITLYQGMELKIIDASFQSGGNGSLQPAGTISSISDTVKISCVGGEELLVHYLSLNGIPIPGRYAKQYGITEGERLTYPSD